jgi:hypothetical protein
MSKASNALHLCPSAAIHLYGPSAGILLALLYVAAVERHSKGTKPTLRKLQEHT